MVCNYQFHKGIALLLCCCKKTHFVQTFLSRKDEIYYKMTPTNLNFINIKINPNYNDYQGFSIAVYELSKLRQSKTAAKSKSSHIRKEQTI